MDLMKHEIRNQEYEFYKGGLKVATFYDLSSLFEYAESIVSNFSSTYDWDSVSVYIVKREKKLFKKEIITLIPLKWSEVEWALDYEEEHEMYDD